MSGMFDNLPQSFRQVIIKAYNIPKKLKIFLKKNNAYVELSDKIMDTKLQPIKGQMDKKIRTKYEGIDKADNFFVWTNIVSGQKGIYHQVEFHRFYKYQDEHLRNKPFFYITVILRFCDTKYFNLYYLFYMYI